MATTTVNALPQIASPVSADKVSAWDASAGTAGYIEVGDLITTAVTGGGTIATGGFTLTVPGTMTAAGRNVANTFSERQTLSDGAITGSVTCALDAQETITMPSEYGICFFVSLSAATAAIIFYRVAASSESITIMSQGGTSYTTTIGTSNRINLRANNDGTITFENKLSATTTTYRYFVIPY